MIEKDKWRKIMIDINIIFIGLGIGAMAIFLSIMFMLKVDNAYYQRRKVMYAIHGYNLRMIDNNTRENSIRFECMESFNSTLYRLWDWGCKRIVPNNIYEKIKPYMNKGKIYGNQ